MALRVKSICNYPGCNELVIKGFCDTHKKEKEKQRKSSADRGYTARWRKYRLGFLMRNPLCVECMKSGMIVSANVVDHIVPHKGNYDLFWNVKNHQSLCKRHHDIKTATEDGGFTGATRNK